jgi:hypothetical protein
MVRLGKNWLRAVRSRTDKTRKVGGYSPSTCSASLCHCSASLQLQQLHDTDSDPSRLVFQHWRAAKPTGLPISCRCAVRHAKRHSAMSCGSPGDRCSRSSPAFETCHEETHARSRRTDHFRQCLLADLRYDRLGPTLPKFASGRRARAKRFSLELNS